MLDSSAVERLMGEFFVNASIPPQAGGPAPRYQFNPDHFEKYEVAFATELDADLERLGSCLKVGLFHYGPPMWRLGYTDHYQALTGGLESGVPPTGAARDAIWQEVLARCTTKTMQPGNLIFRVRKGEALPAALAAEFDSPPIGTATSGRYESAGVPIFYGADDVETCLHESRVALSDWIGVASFTPSSQLRLLDLSGDFEDAAANSAFDRIDIMMNKLAFVGKGDYDLCREAASHVRDMGFDGFYFTSYFAQARKKNLRNIALFGHPVAAGKLTLQSVNRVQLTNVEYGFRFGPHNDTSLPIDRAEMQALAAAMADGSLALKEARAALDELVNRRSAGPR